MEQTLMSCSIALRIMNCDVMTRKAKCRKKPQCIFTGNKNTSSHISSPSQAKKHNPLMLKDRFFFGHIKTVMQNNQHIRGTFYRNNS